MCGKIDTINIVPMWNDLMHHDGYRVDCVSWLFSVPALWFFFLSMLVVLLLLLFCFGWDVFISSDSFRLFDRGDSSLFLSVRYFLSHIYCILKQTLGIIVIHANCKQTHTHTSQYTKNDCKFEKWHHSRFYRLVYRRFSSAVTNGDVYKIRIYDVQQKKTEGIKCAQMYLCC